MQRQAEALPQTGRDFASPVEYFLLLLQSLQLQTVLRRGQSSDGRTGNAIVAVADIVIDIVDAVVDIADIIIDIDIIDIVDVVVAVQSVVERHGGGHRVEIVGAVGQAVGLRGVVAAVRRVVQVVVQRRIREEARGE